MGSPPHRPKYGKPDDRSLICAHGYRLGPLRQMPSQSPRHRSGAPIWLGQ
ncbi:Uncharacterised protein [Vibrio cholerae]|nr:Uncharacterised protein [Vibrio cholerae]